MHCGGIEICTMHVRVRCARKPKSEKNIHIGRHNIDNRIDSSNLSMLDLDTSRIAATTITKHS